MNADVHFCFGCGAANRLPSNMKSRARCGACGEPVYPDIFSYSDRKAKKPQKAEKVGYVKGILLAGIAGFFIWVALENQGDTSKKYLTDNEVFGTSVADLPPQKHQSHGVMWYYVDWPRLAPLTVVTSPGSDYYVKLEDFATGSTVLDAYAVGGRPLEMEVPLGVYRLKYASGDVWRGREHFFGPGNLTSYAASDQPFKFEDRGSYYSGYTVELILQSGGNLSTKKLSASQF